MVANERSRRSSRSMMLSGHRTSSGASADTIPRHGGELRILWLYYLAFYAANATGTFRAARSVPNAIAADAAPSSIRLAASTGPDRVNGPAFQG